MEQFTHKVLNGIIEVKSRCDFSKVVDFSNVTPQFFSKRPS